MYIKEWFVFLNFFSKVIDNKCLLIQSPIPLPEMIHIKVLLLGNSGVGKTSLVHRYLYGVYDNSPATVSLLDIANL